MAHPIQASLSTNSEEKYQYKLHNSFILDTGATGHVCNNRERFIELRDPSPTDFLIAGNNSINICG